MKEKKAQQKDIFTELFDSIFEILFQLISDFFERILKWLLNSSNSRKFEFSTQMKVHSSVNPESLGFENTTKTEFEFNNYNSDVPLSVVLGPPGVGKTVLLLNLIDRDLYMGRPYVVIDPKASDKSKLVFVELSKRYGREPLIFEPGSSLRFNPLKSLDPVQVVEAVYRAFPNDHEYYGPRSKDILLDIVRKLKTLKSIVSFYSIYKDLEEISKSDKQIQIETQGLQSNLKMLLNSPFGILFQDRGDALSLTEIREKSLSLYISLPTLAYSALSESLAKIFIAELMNHSYEAMNRENFKKPLSVYIDEAGSFLFEDFKSLPAQCREAGVCLTIATQSASDLRRISANFLNQILTYAANLWIFRASDPQDAETISRYIGTKKTTKQTIQTEDGRDSGKGSERDTEEFIVHTNVLKNLPKYTAILKSSESKDPKYISVRNIEEIYKFEKQSKQKLKKSNRNKEIDIFDTTLFD